MESESIGNNIQLRILNLNEFSADSLSGEGSISRCGSSVVDVHGDECFDPSKVKMNAPPPKKLKKKVNNYEQVDTSLFGWRCHHSLLLWVVLFPHLLQLQMTLLTLHNQTCSRALRKARSTRRTWAVMSSKTSCTSQRYGTCTSRGKRSSTQRGRIVCTHGHPVRTPFVGTAERHGA